MSHSIPPDTSQSHRPRRLRLSKRPRLSKRDNSELGYRTIQIRNIIPPKYVCGLSQTTQSKSIRPHRTISADEPQQAVGILHPLVNRGKVIGTPARQLRLPLLRVENHGLDAGKDHHVPVTPRLGVGRAVTIRAFVHSTVERNAATAAED